jgi:hypothetical protein
MRNDDLRAFAHRLARPVIVVAFVVVLAGRLYRLAYRYAVNIFFWDQWVFYDADLFQKHSLWEMFRWQFGPHRLGLGPLVSTLIEPHFRWNARAQSFLACTIVTMAALCALWLKWRLFGNLTAFDIVIPIAYLSAGQYESLFTVSDLAHGSLPLLLITLYCLAWTANNLPVRYAFVLALNFITIYTGFGLFVGVITPLLVSADFWSNLRPKQRGWFYLAAGLLASCASLASFFVGYTLQPAVECFSRAPLSPYLHLAYITLLFSNFWTKGVGPLAFTIGGVAVVWLVWTLSTAVWAMPRLQGAAWLRKAIPAALIGFSLLFALNAALGRLCLGLASAQASRYTNYLALGLVGAYLNLLNLRPTQVRNSLLTVTTVAFLATIPIRADDRYSMRAGSEIKLNWKKCYLAGGTIPECDTVAGFQIEPEPERVLQHKLDFLRRNRINLFAEQQ